MEKKYHLIVIGGGSGGLVAAAGAAGLGARTALIEKNKMGGDCLNTGCVPSKAIIRAAKLVYDAKTAGRFGLAGHDFQIDIQKILNSVREVIGKLEPHDSEERFRGLGVTVYKGNFKFLSPRKLGDGQQSLRAERFVIATGARPFVPPITGLRETAHLTSDNVWELRALPKRLVVLGGGPIGCELAQVFARLGSKVSVVEMMDKLLIREDPEVSQLIMQQFKEEGIEVLTGHKAVEVVHRELTVESGACTRKISFDAILVAVGRAPNVDGLDLEKAGVAYTQKGIAVDPYLRTTARHIYACGDVCSPYQFTHTADFQARLILRNALFPGKAKVDYGVVPWCTFTDPEVARVGLSETEAKQKNVPHAVYTYSMKDLDRAVCDREEGGFIKVLTQKGSDQLLGITIVGSHAGDLLPELELAMYQKIGLKKISRMIHVYPTLAEAGKRIADIYQRSRLTPGVKKWFERYFSFRF